MDLLLYSACIVALFSGCSEASVSEDVFGYFSDPDSGVNHTVRRFTIQNDNNFTVQLINFGATLTGLSMPDKNGVVDDVVLGFDKVESYNDALNPYFGATVGRVANRIRGGTFKLDGATYQLFKNAGNDTLHGGKRGFSRVMWEAESRPDNNQVVMRYVSSNGSEGFPGDVNAEATFTLLATGPQSSQLVITYKAATNQRTPINIVNHAYFNLAGHKSGKDGIYRHKVRINADKYTVLDNTLVPTGEIADVNSTEYDLRNMTVVGDAIKNSSSDGIDINFCIINGTNGLYLRDTAYIVDEESGRFLELATDQPGVQFYTHNNDNDFTGKEGVVYKRHGAFCLETQNYPDAVNHDNFPNSIFEPGKLYSHTSSYVFGILTNDIDEEVKSLQQFTTEMVVEAAVKCLDVIVTPKIGLPTSLPQSMSARFRLGTTIAEACLELGYNGEMGYQTFLYPSEAELRKIFVFLIEKLPKETDKGSSQDDDGVLTLRQKIGESLKSSLSRPWVRSRSAVEFIPFLAEPLETGISLPGQKRDCTPQEWRDYCVNQLPFVHEQLEVAELLVPSLLAENVGGLVGVATNPAGTPTLSASACWSQASANHRAADKMSWLAVREKLVHRNENLRIKSEPPKSDQTQRSADASIADEESDAKSEEQRIEEERIAIEQLREKIEELKTLSKTLNAKLVNVEKETEKEVELARARKRESEIRQRTVDLLPNSDANIAKLEGLLQASVQRMISLAEKWEQHRAPLIQTYREARKRISNRNTESVRQQETTREMREKLRELSDQLRTKETFQTRLQEDIEKLPKDIVTRPAYTRRIMEIIGNIRKQKEDIDKIVRDTKQLQKDINNESGKLERSFTVADDLIFRDAKRDETSKKAYIMLAKLHSEFGELVAMVEENGAIVREIRDLEEQIETEMDKNVAANLKRITADLQQMRQESASLAFQNKKS